MGHFERIVFLAKLLPFSAWKDALLRRHLESCPACAKCLASREEARRILVQVDEVGNLDRIWPAVSEKIGGIAPPRKLDAQMARASAVPPGAAWRFAAAVVGIALAAVLTIGLVRFFRSAPGSAGMPENDAARFQIHYVRIDNEPARTFIFKPHDSEIVIVWAGKNI